MGTMKVVIAAQPPGHFPLFKGGVVVKHRSGETAYAPDTLHLPTGVTAQIGLRGYRRPATAGAAPVAVLRTVAFRATTMADNSAALTAAREAGVVAKWTTTSAGVNTIQFNMTDLRSTAAGAAAAAPLDQVPDRSVIPGEVAPPLFTDAAVFTDEVVPDVNTIIDEEPKDRRVVGWILGGIAALVAGFFGLRWYRARRATGALPAGGAARYFGQRALPPPQVSWDDAPRATMDYGNPVGAGNGWPEQPDEDSWRA